MVYNSCDGSLIVQLMGFLWSILNIRTFIADMNKIMRFIVPPRVFNVFVTHIDTGFVENGVLSFSNDNLYFLEPEFLYCK